jgi:allophanate hydrolase subunit 2
VPRVLGSRSADTLAGLGPASLRRGDILPLGTEAAGEPLDGPMPDAAAPAPGSPLTLLAILGPRDDWFVTATDLGVGDWVVSPHSNRVGLRLDRPAPAQPDNGAVQDPPALRRKDSHELPSEGVVLGAVQVPPSGQPVLFLADHPVTGGYPVIAVVLDDDIDLAAQARPGQRLRFRLEPAT